MFIFVDESGSFAQAQNAGSWCVVAAYVVPEVDRRKVERVLGSLKRRLACAYSDEVKLKHVAEPELKRFLRELGELESTLFVSGIDLGQEDAGRVARHQADQVARIRANRSKMLYEEGRALIDDLSGRVERLSSQLYTQMVWCKSTCSIRSSAPPLFITHSEFPLPCPASGGGWMRRTPPALSSSRP